MAEYGYEKRFRLTVIAEYVGEEPLTEVDSEAARRAVQGLLDYALDKYKELPDWRGPCEVQVEPHEPQLTVSGGVAAILRALERKGFDVS